MAGKNQLATTKQTPGFNQAMERAKLFWTGLRPQQQAYFGVGLAITLAAAVFFVKMISTPDMKPLMNGLEPADAQAISTELAAKKIASVIGPDGTSISVPADQIDAARLEVASHDSPHSGRIGFEIFDKVSWGQTEFDEKVNYQRALEGELERTIQTISNVKSARVHLVMASDSVFLDRERGAKASVTLRLRRGSLSREDYSAISRLVAGAVDELKPTDVVIIDADSNQALGQGSGGGADGENLEQELTRRLIATLAPVVGADRIHASVNVEYETGSSEESQEKYDPAVSATLTMQHSEENTGPGAGAAGVPGASSNVPGPNAKVAVPAAKEPSQSSKTDNNTYGVNHTTRHVIEPAGSIRRLTAAVVLDDAVDRKQQNGKWVETRRKRTPDELKLIGDLAQAAIGFNSVRGDVVSIENLSFDHPEVADPGPATIVEQARKDLNDYSSLVRYAVLLGLFILVYLLTIRPIQKRILSIPNSLLVASRAPVQVATEGEPALETSNNLARRSVILKKQLAEFVQAEPESSTIAVRAWLREEVQ
ncbi:MAG: flagellar basal-body MS-ring/collar protein FliF [Terracidiphilus sp.]|jgi:flagellar M-ring protein FliF